MSYDQITFRFADGLIDRPTIKTLFEKCVKHSSEMNGSPDEFVGFTVGLRCLERLANDAGIPIASLDGLSFADDPDQAPQKGANN